MDGCMKERITEITEGKERAQRVLGQAGKVGVRDGVISALEGAVRGG